MTIGDIDFMREALQEAQKAVFLSPPNPAVGCVIVRDGKILSRGFTHAVGERHAEVDAIENAKAGGVSIEGATLYVTLEPCSHTGRTPPCASRIVKEKLARVVAATVDPNPLVAGTGIEILKKAGVAVDVGCCQKEAEEINRGFIKRMKTGLPWIRLKVASSLDAKTALPNGESQWITSDNARRDAHCLRGEAQGLLTGIGTVLADDPRMDVREKGYKSPRKYIVDSTARTPSAAKILVGEKTVIFVSSAAPETRIEALKRCGAEIRVVEKTGEGLDLNAVLHSIGEDGINVLHVEAGAMLNGALLACDCVDEVVLYMAPFFLGAGKSLASFKAKEKLADYKAWEIVSTRSIGTDIRIDLRKK